MYFTYPNGNTTDTMKKEQLLKSLEVFKTVHWRFVIKAAALLSALVVLSISLLYFYSGIDENSKSINQSRVVLRTSLHSLASLASDYDNDRILEPPAPTDLNGNSTGAVGFFVPPALGIPAVNKNGKPFVYCAWDYGKITDAKRFYLYKNNQGESEILLNPAPTTIFMALVDPGPDGKYENRCDSVGRNAPTVGDDIIETLHISDAEQFSAKKVAVRKKNNRNCAFGEVYVWNDAKQMWECALPAAEDAQAMPAGCPTGKALVQRNKKIKCEDIAPIIGEEEEDTLDLPAASQNAEVTDNNTKVVETKASEQLAPPVASNDVVLPSAAGGNTRNNSLSEQLGSNGPVAAGGGATANKDASIAAQPAASIDQEINSATAQKTAGSANKRNTRKIIQRTPAPGENISAAIEDEYFDEDEDLARHTGSAQRQIGGNLMKSSSGGNYAEEESSLEMEIKKRKRNYKLKSCNPWMYLPRSVGVVNQCVKINSFGDFFGTTSQMTSWPAAKSFLQGAFMFCPTDGQGNRIPCRAISFDKDFPVLNSPNHGSNQDGFICARMFNPLPPPWPQFESFIYSEQLVNGAKCRIDQMPFFDQTQNPAAVMCMGLADVISGYRHNGYCGCGWQLIWNPTYARFVCS